jgi:hypothetical protein
VPALVAKVVAAGYKRTVAGKFPRRPHNQGAACLRSTAASNICWAPTM